MQAWQMAMHVSEITCKVEHEGGGGVCLDLTSLVYKYIGERDMCRERQACDLLAVCK